MANRLFLGEEWTGKNDHIHRVANAFTVLRVRLFGDVDDRKGVNGQ
ncbi:MAG: hypothetical protein ACOX7Q_16320 [Kiritimatiellia bacterium]|jgi:hypothetical protein